MNPICHLLGHWKRPFVVDTPTFTTTGATCRLCGAFLELTTTHKPEALAELEPFVRSHYAQQLAHGPGMLYGRYTAFDDFLADCAAARGDPD